MHEGNFDPEKELVREALYVQGKEKEYILFVLHINHGSKDPRVRLYITGSEKLETVAILEWNKDIGLGTHARFSNPF